LDVPVLSRMMIIFTLHVTLFALPIYIAPLVHDRQRSSFSADDVSTFVIIPLSV